MGLNGKLVGPWWTLRNKRHFVVSDFAIEDFYCILLGDNTELILPRHLGIYLAMVQLNLNSYLDNPERECDIKSWITSLHKHHVWPKIKLIKTIYICI